MASTALLVLKLVPMAAVLWYVGHAFGGRAALLAAGPLLFVACSGAVMWLALTTWGPETMLWVLLPLAGVARGFQQFTGRVG